MSHLPRGNYWSSDLSDFYESETVWNLEVKKQKQKAESFSSVSRAEKTQDLVINL